MIKLFHGADLHLDSPFSSLSPEQAQERRGLQRKLPEKMVALANERGCRLMLLSGDIFDGAEPYPETVQALKQALSCFDGWVFIAPGNHDPYTPQSVWAQQTWPENVHVFCDGYACVTLAQLGCCVHGGAFSAPECDEPLPQVQQQGYVQIGVFHGEISATSRYRAISMEQIRRSGLDYLALGHVHKMSFPRQCGKTWFGWPGVAMSRGFDELGPCGGLYVQLHDGECEAEFLPIENPGYLALTMTVQQPPAIAADSRNYHCRLRVVGQAEAIDREAIRQQYAPHFLSVEVIDETEPVQDLWESCGDGSLRGTALAYLKAHEDQELAQMAAKYLIAALEGRQPI